MMVLSLLFLSSILGIAGCGSLGTTLIGTGATFPDPIYQKWFVAFNEKHPRIRVIYQAVGSGAGVHRFSQQLVDFGASDKAMKDQEIDKLMPHPGVIMLPVTAGSVVLGYHVPNLTHDLQLSQKAYIGIYTGRVEYWDDPLITGDNPKLKLPHEKITVIRRAEGSGTTFAFTNHLAAAAADQFKSEGTNPVLKILGKPAKSVGWPSTFLGARGNSGVISTIRSTPYSIGYVEYGYVKKALAEAEQEDEAANIRIAKLQNKAGKFHKPINGNGQPVYAEAALNQASKAEGFTMKVENLLSEPNKTRVFIPNPDGEDSYPIVTFTWILVYQQYDNPRTVAALKELLEFCLSDEAQQLAVDEGYISLPKEIRNKIRAMVELIQS